MRSVIVSLLLTLRATLHDRAALQLEILALRHQLHVINRSRPQRLRLTHADPNAVGLAVQTLERMAFSSRRRQTRDGPCLALSAASGSSGRGKPTPGLLPPVGHASVAGQGFATAPTDRATNVRPGGGQSTGRRSTPSLRPPSGVIIRLPYSPVSWCRNRSALVSALTIRDGQELLSPGGGCGAEGWPARAAARRFPAPSTR